MLFCEQFHLKRFQYDAATGELIKVNGCLSYPAQLDMAPYFQDTTRCTKYDLFSVIVHQGSIYSGHYFAYISRRCGGSCKWYCCNDNQVAAAPLEHVFGRNFGVPPNVAHSEASRTPPTAYVSARAMNRPSTPCVTFNYSLQVHFALPSTRCRHSETIAAGVGRCPCTIGEPLYL